MQFSFTYNINRLFSKLCRRAKLLRRFGARILIYFYVHSGSALLSFLKFLTRSEFRKKSIWKWWFWWYTFCHGSSSFMFV